MYMVYTKILLLLLASSCVREQDLKQSNTFYTRLFRPNEQLLGLIDNTPIKVYRIKIFNVELGQLEATDITIFRRIQPSSCWNINNTLHNGLCNFGYS